MHIFREIKKVTTKQHAAMNELVITENPLKLNFIPERLPNRYIRFSTGIIIHEQIIFHLIKEESLFSKNKFAVHLKFGSLIKVILLILI